MTNKRLITPVADTVDKQRTYREQMGKYSQAMRYGFYLQAVMIDYAMMEDRLRSMLYHMGFLSNRIAPNIWKKTRPYLEQMVETYTPDGKPVKLGIKNISGKIELVRCVMLWARDEGAANDDKFLATLKRQCKRTNIGAVLSTLESITAWCGYRNEVVHALMNKNLDSLDAELQQRAEEGMDLARALDGEIKKLKKGDKVRKCMNLPFG